MGNPIKGLKGQNNASALHYIYVGEAYKKIILIRKT